MRDAAKTQPSSSQALRSNQAAAAAAAATASASASTAPVSKGSGSVGSVISRSFEKFQSEAGEKVCPV